MASSAGGGVLTGPAMWNYSIQNDPPSPYPTSLVGSPSIGGWSTPLTPATISPTGNYSFEDFSNSTANATVGYDLEEVLARSLGPRHRSLLESIILSIVYGAIFLTGVVGNVSTCIVITRNSTMHTATNYYLFSLAISDVLTLILALPPELYTIWIAYPWAFGEPFCVFKIFLSEMTCSASVLTITAFTVERYVAICHPIKSQTMSSLPRAIKTIVCMWLAACLCSLPYPIHAGTFYFVNYPGTDIPIPDSLQCNIQRAYVPRMMYIIQASTFILFIAPMTIISVLYIRIGLTLRQSSIARRNTVSAHGTNPASQQSRRAVLKMLGTKFARIRHPTHSSPVPSGEKKKQSKRARHEGVHAYLVAVVVAFFLCWAPFHAQRLMTTFIPDEMWTALLIEIQSILFYISGVLYFVSSTVNPILYNLMSRKYRKSFKDTLCRCFLPPAERRLHERYGGFSDRYSNTYVTVAGTNNSSRLIASDRSPTRLTTANNSSRQSTQAASPVNKDNSRSQLELKNGWGTTYKTRLLSTSNLGNTGAANGQAGGGLLTGKYKTNCESCPITAATADKAPIIKEEVEMADITSSSGTGEEGSGGVYHVIRMKDHMKGGTYL